jgi:hypothetical protein
MYARKSILIIFPIIALMMMACSLGTVNLNRTVVEGSGVVKTEEREVSGVERVSLEDTGELEIIQGSEEGLTIEADDNILPYIETEMRGRELVIRLQNNIHVEPDTQIHYTLKVKSLNRVSVSGSGDVYAKTLDTGDLEVIVSGSGNITVDDLQAEDLTVRISGSGNFDLTGAVKTQSVSISGSGNYTAGDLESQTADISITGSGNVTVWVTDELTIKVSGFGNVNYYGSPSISQTITGGGEVNSLGEHE